MDYNNMRELNDKIYDLENELKKYKSIDLDEIQNLVYMANEMKYLLTQCRNEQIDFRLAKEIDKILSKLEE
jgi:hypothetical protein